mmetsp:Transcript_91500/g.261452  ORF Transcript_91500/g.261452 Transcript_91500/m.261452 type:complete len:233 (+) Transcript_91500:464-1162(+)
MVPNESHHDDKHLGKVEFGRRVELDCEYHHELHRNSEDGERGQAQIRQQVCSVQCASKGAARGKVGNSAQKVCQKEAEHQGVLGKLAADRLRERKSDRLKRSGAGHHRHAQTVALVRVGGRGRSSYIRETASGHGHGGPAPKNTFGLNHAQDSRDRQQSGEACAQGERLAEHHHADHHAQNRTVVVEFIYRCGGAKGVYFTVRLGYFKVHSARKFGRARGRARRKLFKCSIP